MRTYLEADILLYVETRCDLLRAEGAEAGRLDPEAKWEDNRRWSGTSKQVRTRKPFEP